VDGDVDVALAGLIAARGFWDDPVQNWLHPQDRLHPDPERLARMTAQFRSVASHHLLRGGRVDFFGPDAVAMWAPPGAPEIDFAPPPEEDLALFLEEGFVERVQILEAAMSDAHPSEPHWYLGVICAVPERRGAGLGAELIGRVLGICDTEGHPSYLESSNPRNLSFYFRHGYEQIGEIRLEGGPSMYPMWRPPRTP
jgi:GNAT superfamily N-acetyltransferase